MSARRLSSNDVAACSNRSSTLTPDPPSGDTGSTNSQCAARPRPSQSDIGGQCRPDRNRHHEGPGPLTMTLGVRRVVDAVPGGRLPTIRRVADRVVGSLTGRCSAPRNYVTDRHCWDVPDQAGVLRRVRSRFASADQNHDRSYRELATRPRRELCPTAPIQSCIALTTAGPRRAGAAMSTTLFTADQHVLSA